MQKPDRQAKFGIFTQRTVHTFHLNLFGIAIIVVVVVVVSLLLINAK